EPIAAMGPRRAPAGGIGLLVQGKEGADMLPSLWRRGGGLSTQRMQPLEQFRRDFDALFDRVFGGLAPFEQEFEPTRLWDFDVNEGDKEVVVRAELPGFNEKEVDVQLNDNMLTVKAEKQEKKDGEERYGSYRRTVTLPSGIDADKATANYRNGVLEMHLPRKEQ